MSFTSFATPFINNSLRTADAFPVVASLPSSDRKCVCCSQATPLRVSSICLVGQSPERLKIEAIRGHEFTNLESKSSFIASHCICFSTLSVATQEKLQSLHKRVSHRKAFDSWKIDFSAQNCRRLFSENSPLQDLY